MKTQLSMRQWAFAVILMPIIIFSVVLGSYVVYKRHVELDDSLMERGRFISEPLALLSAHSIEQKDNAFLIKALDLAHRSASPVVNNISVFTPDHKSLLSTNQTRAASEARLPPGRVIPTHTQFEVEGDTVYVRSPIWGTDIANDSVLMIKGEERVLYGYIVIELSRTKVLLEQQNAQVTLFFMFIVCLLVCVGVAFWFSNKMITPLYIINKAIQKIDKGETKTKIVEEMSGEYEMLREGINSLCKKLHVANELAEHNISEHTQELQQTVEQLEEQNIELSIARKDAQTANDVKSQFLANMSHELRTPLNGVLGFTRQLKKTRLNSNQTDFLETIDSSAKNLLRIINDILDFSKLDAGKMELETLPFSLRDTVNEVMTLMAPNVFDKNLDIHLRIDSRVPDALRGDPDRIKQVLINLMGNALKFTNEGFIRIDVKYLGSDPQGHKIKFIVADTGIGIDEIGKKRLFAAFGQADSSVTRKYGGTGLGLSICKKLVEVMGGDIGFSSKEGQGSTFHFSIQVKENNLPVAQSLPVDDLVGRQALLFDQNEQSNEDILTVLKDYTSLEVKSVFTEDAFLTEISKGYDFILMNCDVSPNTLGRAKQLISEAKAQCQLVYVLINSISPNLKEALLGSGAKAALSLPVNHAKLIKTIAEPYRVLDQNEAVNTVSFKGVKVLAVDDNDANVKLLSTLLDDMAITADTAQNGREAVEMAKKHTYDLIFMDIQMPVMDGITACKVIKEDSLNESTPIISVTAHAGPDEQKRFQEAGFADYLSKPIDEEMLNQVLVEFTGIHCDLANNKSASSSTQRSEQEPEYAKYHHVDWAMALERAAGKHDLAVQMLSMLVKSIPSTLEQLEMYVEEQNVDELTKVIHKFHGACCYTGVPKIRALAEQIEIGLKAEHDLEMVEPELFELIDELTKFKEQAKTWTFN